MNATVKQLLDQGARDLSRGTDARREAQILLGHALGVSRAWLGAHGEDTLHAGAAALFRDLVERRGCGTPVAYLVGRREFYGLEFRVTPDVLIPRADSETLVDVALEKLAAKAAHEVLDLGTGSGCIAIAIAHARPSARVTAVDTSEAALKVALENAAGLGVDVAFVHGSWFDPLHAKRFDLIVSNPPYLAMDDAHLKQGDLRFEPHTALVSAGEGLADIRLIVANAPAHLHEGGWLLVEHGFDQAGICRDLLRDAGFIDVYTCVDTAGLPRVAAGRLLTSKSSNR